MSERIDVCWIVNLLFPALVFVQLISIFLVISLLLEKDVPMTLCG